MMDQRDFGLNSCLNGHLIVLAAFVLNFHAYANGGAFGVVGVVMCGFAWFCAWKSSGMTAAQYNVEDVVPFTYGAIFSTLGAWLCFIPFAIFRV